MSSNLMMILNTVKIWLDKYIDPDFITWILLNLAKSLFVFFIAWVFVRVCLLVIRRCFRTREGTPRSGMEDELFGVIGSVLRTLILYGAYFTAFLISLQFFGLSILDRLNLVILAGNLLKIAAIIIVSRMIVKIGQNVIERVFNKPAQTDFFGETKRIETLKALLKSILMYSVYFVALLTILANLGVNTASILASAGILGLAVGFGAQNLVKDIITGFFIIFENYFSVGDYINTAGVTGTVEEIGLRTTKLRDATGELHIVPNSEITKVTNHCRGKMRALVDIGITYEEDIDRAIKVLQMAANQVAEEFGEKIIDHPEVLGVQSLGSFQVIIRVVAYTKPMEQWAVERELRKCLKQALDQSGIEIPSPAQYGFNTEGSE